MTTAQPNGAGSGGALPWRLIVFDCDGTLVDSQHAIVAGMHAAFEAVLRPRPEPEAIRRVVGLSLEEAISRLLPEEQPDPDTVEAIADNYRIGFQGSDAQAHRGAPLYPGARQALTELDRRQILLGIATGKGRRGLTATLESHGLEALFVTLQTADVAPSKPHPGMLHRAMAEAGATPQETLLVGDTVFDMEMAANARVGGIGVAWGYHAREELAAAGALAIVESFVELVPALEELGGRA